MVETSAWRLPTRTRSPISSLSERWDGSPQAHRANAGFPDVDTLLDRYGKSSGTDLGEIDFYRALATYKLAVISQGAAKRATGVDADRAARTTETVSILAEKALDLSRRYA